MRPLELTTEIFLDSSDPAEVKEALLLLGFLDGVSTSYVSLPRNPRIKELIDSETKVSESEANLIYKEIIEEIAEILPQGDMHIPVVIGENVSSDSMISDAKEKTTWTSNVRIKLPINKQGIKAAIKLSKDNVNLNMNMCFNQEQAAAVYAATDIDSDSDIIISPFIGRLDDVNRDGTDLLLNIMRMYTFTPRELKVNASSIRDLPHFLYCLYLKPDYVTVPLAILKEWVAMGMKVPGVAFEEEVFAEKASYFESLHEDNLKGLNYIEYDLDKKWDEFDSEDELTPAATQRHIDAWNKFVK